MGVAAYRVGNAANLFAFLFMYAYIFEFEIKNVNEEIKKLIKSNFVCGLIHMYVRVLQ